MLLHLALIWLLGTFPASAVDLNPYWTASENECSSEYLEYCQNVRSKELADHTWTIDRCLAKNFSKLSESCRERLREEDDRLYIKAAQEHSKSIRRKRQTNSDPFAEDKSEDSPSAKRSVDPWGF